MREPTLAEKDFRKRLRDNSVVLRSLTAGTALEAMVAYYRELRDYSVLPEEGDGLVTYEDVTNHGRGGRLEIGIIRLFRTIPPEPHIYRMPALRLRLRLCFKWDAEIVSSVLPRGTWSYCGWSPQEVDGFVETVLNDKAFSVMAGKAPSEVNVRLEETTYPKGAIRPKAGARQMWWGVWDVA